VSGMARALVYLRRIAAALDRAYPPVPPQRRRAEFSVSSAADFERGWDARTAVEEEVGK
jgi:hypothetical protein